MDGLGLVPFSVDVHCAQWGHAAPAAVGAGGFPGGTGVGLDENTLLTVSGRTAYGRAGTGHAWLVTSGADGSRVRALRHGEEFTVPA